jgi:hypothetical protein
MGKEKFSIRRRINRVCGKGGEGFLLSFANLPEGKVALFWGGARRFWDLIPNFGPYFKSLTNSSIVSVAARIKNCAEIASIAAGVPKGTQSLSVCRELS